MAGQRSFAKLDRKAGLDYFPFMKLPPEIRTMVYELLLVQKTGWMMTPDPTGHNERTLDAHNSPRFSNHSQEGIETVGPNFCDRIGFGSGLCLIRTSKQICNEGTAVLYGMNVFWFSDDRPAEAEAKDCSPAWYELDSLPIWLRYIGRGNVQKIRRLYICISGLVAAFSHKEPDLPGTVCPAGDALIQAFDYLSFGHNLHSLELSFPSPEDFFKELEYYRQQEIVEEEDEMSEKAYAIFFRRSDTAILKSLRKLRGVREFICPDWHETWPSAAGVMRLVKSEIESQASMKADCFQDATAKPVATTQRVLQSEVPLSIRERLTQLEQERAKNIKLLGQLLGNLRKQGEDIAGLMKEVDEVSSRMVKGNGPCIG